MKKFKGFVLKEFYHILRDKRTLLILFGMPVIQLILFGYAIRNEINDVKVVIVDYSQDEVTRQITQQLLSSPYFVASIVTEDASQIETAFRQGIAKEAIVFESNFAQKLVREGNADIQLILNAVDPNTANTILAYTNAIVAEFVGKNNPAGANLIAVRPDIRMRYNPELKSAFLFVPGLVALILMLVCTLMTSITITREKELGTMEVLLVSPLKPVQIILGKVVPYLILSFANVITILVIARYAFDVPVRGSLILLLAESLLFIVCALSLGILISTRTSSQQTAMMISLAGLLLPTVILSGFIFPISSMPAALQVVSNIVPAKWFLSIIRGIMIKGIGVEYVWRETLVLTGMTFVFILGSVRNFGTRL